MPSPQLASMSRGFSFFGAGGSNKVLIGPKNELVPSLKLQTDKDAYRPGDSVNVTIEIAIPDLTSHGEGADNALCSFLIERLAFEMKGIEKLDTQWFATQKLLPGSKQRRGEHVFMDYSAPCIVSNQIVSSGASKTYVVRTMLPNIIPPSYRGVTIRYLYFVRSMLSGRWLVLESGRSHSKSLKDLTELEARIPLQIWATQKASGLQIEEGWSDGIVPPAAIQMDIYWKEMDGDSDWARANDGYDAFEEGYESSRDEISSVSSYNHIKENIHKSLSSLSVQSSLGRSSNKNTPNFEGERTSLSSYMALPRLSVAEVLYDSGPDVLSSQMSPAILSPSEQRKHMASLSPVDEAGVSSVPGTVEPVASEGFIRGRSYNIRLDDEVLLRFSPKNSESTYYFSDMIGGTLTFFHEEGTRRCLEVSITLETSEAISQQFVHPSRRNSPTITKVQSDHHEVVADLVQTSFLFSIPMDGPMSFCTPHVSVQWALRFEFFTTPKHMDWTRFDHPLLIDRREKNEWVLPITVHAPPPGTPATHNRNEKPVSLEPMWVCT
ncbi:uncharacterized protein LOC131154126 [Malania oleifera]|uniref:uncharacterized protein LOC131154126 n=1 Tax=Malania oleifera TaxID=397392 RepID=UPI0025AE702B|nr:uncharacterized protein LOC131154126 [Malania oleifera]XP_057962645.1 uncharacterized protein LOC131154126 [Malania oleifera]